MERTGGDRLPTQVAVDAIVGKGLNPRDRRCLGAVDGCIGHDAEDEMSECTTGYGVLRCRLICERCQVMACPGIVVWTDG